MPKHADGCTRVRDGLIDLICHVQGRHRNIGRRQHFGHGDHVRLQMENLCAKCLSQPAKTGNDLINQKQDVVFLQNRLHFVKVSRRGHDHAAGTLHGLGNEGCHRLGAFAQDGVFQFLRQPVNELALGFAWQSKLVQMGAAHPDDAGQGKVKVLMHRCQA